MTSNIEGRDMLVNVHVVRPTGEYAHIGEIQLVHQQLLITREGLPGHEIYGRVRNAMEITSVAFGDKKSAIMILKKLEEFATSRRSLNRAGNEDKIKAECKEAEAKVASVAEVAVMKLLNVVDVIDNEDLMLEIKKALAKEAARVCVQTNSKLKDVKAAGPHLIRMIKELFPILSKDSGSSVANAFGNESLVNTLKRLSVHAVVQAAFSVPVNLKAASELDKRIRSLAVLFETLDAVSPEINDAAVVDKMRTALVGYVEDALMNVKVTVVDMERLVLKIREIAEYFVTLATVTPQIEGMAAALAEHASYACVDKKVGRCYYPSSSSKYDITLLVPGIVNLFKELEAVEHVIANKESVQEMRGKLIAFAGLACSKCDSWTVARVNNVVEKIPKIAGLLTYLADFESEIGNVEVVNGIKKALTEFFVTACIDSKVTLAEVEVVHTNIKELATNLFKLWAKNKKKIGNDQEMVDGIQKKLIEFAASTCVDVVEAETTTATLKDAADKIPVLAGLFSKLHGYQLKIPNRGPDDKVVSKIAAMLKKSLADFAASACGGGTVTLAAIKKVEKNLHEFVLNFGKLDHVKIQNDRDDKVMDTLRCALAKYVANAFVDTSALTTAVADSVKEAKTVLNKIRAMVAWFPEVKRLATDLGVQNNPGQNKIMSFIQKGLKKALAEYAGASCIDTLVTEVEWEKTVHNVLIKIPEVAHLVRPFSTCNSKDSSAQVHETVISKIQTDLVEMAAAFYFDTSGVLTLQEIAKVADRLANAVGQIKKKMF